MTVYNDSTVRSTVPTPAAVQTRTDSLAAPGTVVWHRTDLRAADNPALAAAGERSFEADDHAPVLPLFIFDPAFYDGRGLACDARIEFLHESLCDLDRQYRDRGAPGLTYAHGDPIAVLDGFAAAGWDIVATQTPTGRYGRKRDRRAETELSVEFVAGDGLVRNTDHSRQEWKQQIESWLAAEPFEWDSQATSAVSHASRFPDGTTVTPESIASRYGVRSDKTMVPEGGRAVALDRLASFVDRIDAYPGSISSPAAARDGTSGLAPYLRFGCLSVREVTAYLEDHAPDGRGRSMFVSRLFWNRHYRQKLADWSGWLDVAVNPVYRGFNQDRHDPNLVAAWKHGETGYPMVDASMRCLRETGWLNFRMRALCASFYFHILQQPWRIGADHFYTHLIDADAAINYTQWQSQCGLIGRPGLRLYNPRKQVRDQDPDGEFITRWVPALKPLPATHLDRPERTPLSVQEECGVRIGETYPYPVVEYEAARAAFRDRYGSVYPQAAARLADAAIARRASLSGGMAAARSIADTHGASQVTPTTETADRSDSAQQTPGGTQTDLSDFGDDV